VGKEQRRLYVCPQCNGAQMIIEWKRAQLSDHPEVEEVQATEICPACDGAGQILGSAT
jgi:DnaJ-class molecular chaperone